MKGSLARGSNCKIIQCVHVTRRLYEWLIKMSKACRVVSGDKSPPDYNLKRLRECWIRGDDEMMLWVLLSGKQMHGYAITEIASDWYGKMVFISEAWIEPEYRRRSLPAEGFKLWAAWGREHGAKIMRFGTQRNAKAYKRLLGKGWHEGGVIFEREI